MSYVNIDVVQPALILLGVTGFTGFAVILILYLYSTRTFNTFRKVGIPGPAPYPIIGTINLSGDNITDSDTKLWKKYGKFVGTYEGTVPVLMVFDADWLKEAFITNSKVFIDRKPFRFGSALDEGIFSVCGEHWRFARKILAAEFASGKLKKMLPTVQKCTEVFVTVLEDSNGRPVDVRSKMSLLTLDIICQTAFGIDSEAQTKEANSFTQNALLLSRSGEPNGTLIGQVQLRLAFMMQLAPNWLNWLASCFMDVGVFDAGAMSSLEQTCSAMIATRQEDTPGHDLLQTLADKMVEAPRDDPDTLTDSSGLLWTRKGLTIREVIGNTMLILIAGFQTTADATLMIFYELAYHPEAQQKLYEEIMDVCDTEEITSEQMNQLKYLECCVNETLRLYPQGSRFERVAAEDITIRDIQVPKGTAVTASPWVIHRDPEIWENPEEYDPERFLPERLTKKAATAFIPFGIGGRQCIASRLAMIEMKMTIISTLKLFAIEKNELTPRRPLHFKTSIALASTETIMLSFVERK